MEIRSSNQSSAMAVAAVIGGAGEEERTEGGGVCAVEKGPRGSVDGEEREVGTPGSGKLGHMSPMAA